jgi:hypothetical protein
MDAHEHVAVAPRRDGVLEAPLVPDGAAHVAPERLDDLSRDGIAGQPDRAPVLVGVALDRVAQLVEEGDPAFSHVLVQVVPVSAVERARANADHARAQPLVDQLDGLAVLAVLEHEPRRRLLTRVVDEDVLDLALEAVVVPAEPTRHALGLGERPPHVLARRLHHHLDAERPLVSHASSFGFG